MADKWYYKDPKGQEHGPFPEENMRMWFNQNYFEASLLIRKQSEKNFAPLHEVNPAFTKPVPLPSKVEPFEAPVAVKAEPTSTPKHVVPTQPVFPQLQVPQKRNLDDTGFAEPLAKKPKLKKVPPKSPSAEDQWIYIDNSKNIQGPFPTSTMRGWWESGALHDTLPIKLYIPGLTSLTDKTLFTALKEYSRCSFTLPPEQIEQQKPEDIQVVAAAKSKKNLENIFSSDMSKKRKVPSHPLHQIDLIQYVLRFLEPFEVIGLTSVNKVFKIATHQQCAFSTKFRLTHAGVRCNDSKLQAYCNGRVIGRSILWSKVIQTPRICDLIRSATIGFGYNATLSLYWVNKSSMTILFDLRNVSVVRVLGFCENCLIERISKNVKCISFWYLSRSLKSHVFPELRTIYVRGLWDSDVNSIFENLPIPESVPRLSSVCIAGMLSSVSIAGTLSSVHNMSGLNRYPQVEQLQINSSIIERGLPTEVLLHIKTLILKCIPKERTDPYDYDWISWLPNLKRVVMGKRDNVEIIVPSGIEIIENLSNPDDFDLMEKMSSYA